MDADVSLREHLQAEIDALRVLITAELRALALAVNKQENAYDERFRGVNEFRAALDDAANRAATREYVDAKLSER